MSSDIKTFVIKFLGLVAIWIIYVANVITYLCLSIFHKVDILWPFKIFIIVGFAFTILYSLGGLLSGQEGDGILPLIVDFMLLITSALGAILAIPSVLAMQTEIQLSFDISVSIGCIIGIIVGLIGLLLITYHALWS